MAFSSTEHDAAPAVDSADGFEAYRTVSKAALLALFFGVSSILALAFPVFLVLAVLGVFNGWIALRAIRRYPDELSGRVPGWAGFVLSLLILVVGTTMHSVIYATEVPEGYERVPFESLKSDSLGPDVPPEEVLRLDGQRVFIKGYVYPDGRSSGLRRFVLVPDMGTCCFGGQPKLTHMIEVTLVDPLRIDYSVRKRKLAGTIRIDRTLKPVDGLGGVYYQLTADYVR